MLDLNILTPNRVVGMFHVKHVQLPGAEGYLGIRSDHAPLIVKLKPGILSFDTGSEKSKYYVSSGFAQVANNVLEVLIENAEAPTEIDRVRAQDAEKRALDRLKALSPEINIPRTLRSLDRARQRLLLLEQSGHSGSSPHSR